MASAAAASRTSAASPARSLSRSDVESEGTGTGPEPSLKECARGFPKTASDTARALVHSLFKLPPADVLFSDFACALEEMPVGGASDPAPRVSLYGRLYVTSSAICFFADAASWEGVAVRKVLPFKYVDRLHQHRVAWMLPAMLLSVSAKGIRRSYLLRGFFGSGRDEALSLCKTLLQHWQPDKFRSIVTPESASGGPSAADAGPPTSIVATGAGDAGFDDDELEGTGNGNAGVLVGSAASGGGGAGRARAGTETAAATDPEALAEVEAALGSGRSLADATLPCSVDGFWRELLSDDAGFGALDASRAQGNTEVSVGQWEERQGAGGATPRVAGRRSRSSLLQQAGDGATAQDDVPHLQAHPRLVRAVRFRKKVSGVAFVPSTRVEQRHSLWRLAGPEGRLRLVLVIATRSLDVPYGDTFVIVETWLVEPAGGAGQLQQGGSPGEEDGVVAEERARCRLRITARVQFESRGILSGQIESMSIAGMAPSVTAWLERARAHVAAAASRAAAHGRGAADLAAQRRAGPAAVGDLFTDEQLQLACGPDDGRGSRWSDALWMPWAGSSSATPPIPPDALGDASASDLLRGYGRLFREAASARRAARLWGALAVSLVLAALALTALVAGGWASMAIVERGAIARAAAAVGDARATRGTAQVGDAGDAFQPDNGSGTDGSHAPELGAASAGQAGPHHAAVLSQVLAEMRSLRAERDAAAPAWLTIAAVIGIALVAASLVPARIVLDALGWPQPA